MSPPDPDPRVEASVQPLGDVHARAIAVADDDRSVAGVPAPRAIVSDQRLQAVKRRYLVAIQGSAAAGCAVAVVQAATIGVSAADVFLFLLMYVLTGLGITVGYHRHFAHGSFETIPAIRAILAIAGAMAGHGPLISWAATHRCHHKNSDGHDDPHSPHQHSRKITGLWHAHMGWLLGPELPNSMVFARDLLRDRTIVRVNRLYPLWVVSGLLLPALLGWILTGTLRGAAGGLLWGGFVRLFVSFHATSSINSITHMFGRRPFETRDESGNVAALAFATFGEGWHNNHHAFPASARFGFRWWQLDAGYLAIRLLESAGLAWKIRRADPHAPARAGKPHPSNQ